MPKKNQDSKKSEKNLNSAQQRHPDRYGSDCVFPNPPEKDSTSAGGSGRGAERNLHILSVAKYQVWVDLSFLRWGTRKVRQTIQTRRGNHTRNAEEGHDCKNIGWDQRGEMRGLTKLKLKITEMWSRGIEENLGSSPRRQRKGSQRKTEDGRWSSHLRT